MGKLPDKELSPLSITPSIAEQEGPVSFAIFRLARIHRALAALLLRKIGLHPGQEMLIMHLLDHDGLDQAELIRRMGFDPSTATKMLQRLEHEGFLTRKQSAHDKRAMTIYLTSKGKDLRTPLARMWAELEKSSASELSEPEKKTVIGILSNLEKSICDASL